MGYVFYSLRTTGPDFHFDQIIRISAVHTNHEFRILDKLEVGCKIASHVVPSPSWLIERGISVADLLRDSPSHYEMMREAVGKFTAWSPAVFLGFDSLATSERFLRQALYMTLHDPFLTIRDANGRSDVLRMIEAASVHRPGAISVPRRSDKTADFTLPSIARANGLNVEVPVSLLSENESVIALCRHMLGCAPEVVSTSTRFSQKASVMSFVEEQSIIVLTERIGGKSSTSYVTSIVADAVDQSDCLVFNLAVNPLNLADLSDAALSERLRSSPRPVRRVTANACPFMTEFDDGFPVFGLTSDELKRRSALISQSADLRTRLIKAFRAISPTTHPSPFVEMQLNEASFTPEDRALASKFHEASWNERLSVVEEISDVRLTQIGIRLIEANHNQAVAGAFSSGSERRETSALDRPWRTLDAAFSELNALVTQLPRPVIQEFEMYLGARTGVER